MQVEEGAVNRSAEKAPEVLVDNKLNRSQQCHSIAKKASVILGCVNMSALCKIHEVILLLYLALAGSQLEHSCPVLGTALEERCGPTGESPEESSKNEQRSSKHDL